MTSLFTKSQWSTSPTAYWTIQYESKRSGADMQYRFYWKVWLGYSSSYYNDGLQLQLFINGVRNNVTVKGFTTNTGWSCEGTTGWYTVSNKTTGTTPFYAKLYDTNTSKTKATSSSYSLAVSGAASALGSISNFDVNGSISISITKYDSSFADTLVITYGSTTIKTVSSIANGTKVSFTSAELNTIYGLMKSVKSGTFTFTLTTKSGSTTLGTSTKTATGSISGANPTFTASQVTYADTTKAIYDITGNPLHIVQNKSTLRVTFTAASGQKGADISLYTFVLNGVTKTATSAGYVDFGTVNSSKNLTLSVTVKDSRGNTTTVTKTITMLAYAPPIVNAVLERLNNYEDTTYLTVKASISSVNSKNTMSVKYKYKESGGSYGSAVTINNGQKYTLTCNKNKAFVFSVTVTDKFDSKGTTQEFTLAKGKFPLFIDTKKNAVGINDFPASGEALRVAGGVANFVEGVQIASNPINDQVISHSTLYVNASGNRGAFEWDIVKWKTGLVELSARVVFSNVSVSNSWGSVFTGPLEGSNLSYPVTFSKNPVCVVSPEYLDFNCWIATYEGATSSKTNSPMFQATRATSASLSVALNYYIRGFVS